MSKGPLRKKVVQELKEKESVFRRTTMCIILLATVCWAGTATAGEALRVPEGFRAKEGTTAEPYTETSWAKEIVHEKTGIELVFVPAGEFLMGSPPNEPGSETDNDHHPVRISKPFYVGKYEVTQQQWQPLMGNNPSYFQGGAKPVGQVSWNDVQGFLKKAGGGLRLPTEAQWEYAARAGSTTKFCFGDAEDSLKDYGWFAANTYRTTRPVGRKKPNVWGLYDMYGNVWEWCSDWYDETYYNESPAADPQGPVSGQERVLRGGSWATSAAYCHSAYRHSNDPSYLYYGYGFRVSKACE